MMVKSVYIFVLLFSFLSTPDELSTSYEEESVFRQQDTSAVAQESLTSSTADELLEVNQTLESETADTSDFVLFIGRFHPTFVHLPIGFLLFAFLLECVSYFKRYEVLKHAVPFALLMGVLSGVAAGGTGYLLSLGGGYSDDVLTSHFWLGISVVSLSFVAFLIRITCYEDLLFKKIFRAILVVLTGVVLTTGHLGGSLTHGPDYLFRYMPEPLRSWSGVELEEEEQIELIEDLDNAVVYEDIIAPIIRTRCESCHNPDRTEGELLLTSFDHLMAGGEDGPVIVEHHAGESELFKRLLLPERDEDRMPPRGRRQLTHDQIRLIEWWIDHGVPSTQMVSELEMSEEIAGVLEKLTVDGQGFLKRTVVPLADPKVVEDLRNKGFRLAPIAEGMAFLQVGLTKSKRSLSAEEFEMLLPLREQITWLNLSRVDVSDGDLNRLPELHNLTRLSLQHTGITDSTLSRMGSREHLEYLNLYATQITSRGLQYLKSLTNLNTLYLWQTGVNAEAIEELQNSLPELYINAGVSHDAAATTDSE